jgi:hypothetical protein
MAETIPYLLPDDIASATKCVFKLTFGENREKYFIFKCLKLRPIVESFAAQIYREAVRPKKESMFFKVVAYYRKYRPGMMHVELISGVELKGVDILLAERRALKAAENDPNCLNISFDNTIKQPGWISHADMTTFRDLLKGKTPEDKLRKLDSYLDKYISKKASKERVISYIKKNFM